MREKRTSITSGAIKARQSSRRPLRQRFTYTTLHPRRCSWLTNKTKIIPSQNCLCCKPICTRFSVLPDFFFCNFCCVAFGSSRGFASLRNSISLVKGQALKATYTELHSSRWGIFFFFLRETIRWECQKSTAFSPARRPRSKKKIIIKASIVSIFSRGGLAGQMKLEIKLRGLCA